MSSIESKRVQYRKYLERAGVIDALSKALIKLYEEQNKPEDAIRFVRKFMCESCPDDAQFDIMKADLDEANRKIFELEQDLERLRCQIKKTPEEIAELMDNGFKELIEDEEFTESLLRKYFTQELLDEFKIVITSPPIESNLYDCMQSGFAFHDSEIGVVAADAECYDVYNKIFDPIIKDIHNMIDSEEEVLQKDIEWGNIDEIENLDPERKYILVTRMSLNRNLDGLPFFPKLHEKHYFEIENQFKVAAELFEGEHMGSYHTMGELDTETQQEMVSRKILFDRKDERLQSAGCYRFWPTGRGVYYNPAETFVVWINEMDHYKVISVSHCGDLGDCYHRLVGGIQVLEKNLQFVRHARYGNVSSCLSILGTALRICITIRLPLLYQDEERLRNLARDLSLEVQRLEGDDGVIIVHNKYVMGFNEFELVKTVQDGLVALINTEEEIEAGGEVADGDDV